MRIIGGLFRGKKLDWLCDDKTRPTPDRVKENIFNILNSRGVDFSSARVLDLFAGCGQIGLESYSRGCTQITMNDQRTADLIKRNCELIGAKAKIMSLDYLECLKALAKSSQQFDIVFLDPPFSDPNAIRKATDELVTKNLLSVNAIIIAESENPNLEFQKFDVDLRKYGREYVYVLTAK